MADFSVIIRVKNEERYIGHCLQSVLDFLYKPEIIIIDNESSDQSSMIWGQFKQDPSLQSQDPRYAPLSVYSITDYTPGRALNMGVREATNPNILIISSHCIIKSLSLETLSPLLDQYGCVFGKQIPHYFGKRIRPSYIWSHFDDKPCLNMYSTLEGRYFLHNAFSFFQRDVLLKYPFNDELVGKEDRYWAQYFVDNGNTYAYEPSLIADHHYTDNGNTWKGIG